MRKSLIVSAVLALSVPAMAQDMNGQPAPMTGVRPMHGQAKHAGPGGTMHAKPSNTAVEREAPVRPGSEAEVTGDREYRGGIGSPLSTTASNTTSAPAAAARAEVALSSTPSPVRRAGSGS